MKQLILILVIPFSVLFASEGTHDEQGLEVRVSQENSSLQDVQKSRKELQREARRLKASGIALSTSSGLVGFTGACMLGFLGGVYEQPLFFLGALGTAGVGGLGIWKGVTLVRKGREIENSFNLTISPITDPLKQTYGAQLSIAF